MRNHQFLNSTFLGHPLGHFGPDLCVLIAGGGAVVAIKTVYMKLTWIHFTESSQVLQREREKDVGGLLQLFATMIGFVVMLIVQVCMVTLLFNVLHVSLCTSVHHHHCQPFLFVLWSIIIPAQLYTHHEHEHGDHEHGMLSGPAQVRLEDVNYHQCLKTNLKTFLQMLGGVDVLARSLI